MATRLLETAGKQTMNACRIQADGFLTSHGKAAARVEVQPGDDPLNLGAGSERSEMYALQTPTGTTIEESSSSGVQYYATSYYFPTTWVGTQIHGDSNSWSIGTMRVTRPSMQIEVRFSIRCTPVICLRAVRQRRQRPPNA